METKVKIYTTPNCNYCAQAKEYLTEQGIEFEAFDVTKDREAYQEMRSISGGARSVPVIAVGEEVILGFEREVLDKALKKLT
jgi:glutaredoxin-like YruB-family protein